jgi:hypothetical protein
MVQHAAADVVVNQLCAIQTPGSERTREDPDFIALQDPGLRSTSNAI